VRPGEGKAAPGSASAVRTVGLVLGVAIMAAMLAMLWQDRSARVDAAWRQSLALATGVDRLLLYELRNLERAFTGIGIDADTFARDAPDRAAGLLTDAIAGVLSRHAELASITVYDNARFGFAGTDTGTLQPEWIDAARVTERPLRLGPIENTGDDAWIVPLAMPMQRGGWLVARLRTSEFQAMIDGFDTGRDGRVAVLDLQGTVLARSARHDGFVGRRVPLPPKLRSTPRVTDIETVSELDRVARAVSYVSESGYPLVAGAGIGLDEALAAWWRHAALGVALILCYWVGFVVLLRRRHAHDRARAAMLDELEANASWLRQAQLAARTGVWRVERDRGTVRASEHMAEMFGFSPTTDEIPLERFFERMHPDDRDRVERDFAESRATRAPFKSEYRIVTPEGGERWIIARGAMAVDARGIEHMTGTIVDITERRESLARVERAESQFRELFERNPLPFWVFDVATLRFLAVNKTAINTYGYTRDEFLAMTILDIRPDEDAEEIRESLRESGDGSLDRVWVHFTRDGQRMDVLVHSTRIEFAGRPAQLVLAEDITDRVAHERDLAWRATHDPTTRLLTISALVDELAALSPAPASGYVVAHVQLRDLELVAPTLGRRTSEAILRAAAERFGWIGRTFGFAAYRPAESFVVVAIDASQREDMLASLVRATATPVDAHGGMHPLETWIGVAESGSGAVDPEKVIGNAALAALQARRENMPLVIFDTGLADQASGRLAMAGRLKLALERGEFEVFYQPIRRLASGEMVAMEALLRWRRPDGGFISPLDFIPLCEESGLIVPLGQWVLEEAARSHATLAAQGLGNVAIAVNVSAVQLLSGTVPETLRTLRESYGLPRGALQIELTESVLMRRADTARAEMSQIKAEGVCISLDDFGTGFSSMGYLRDLPIDYLKIDRAFVADVHQDPRNASICRALIALAHGLGLKIVAEGVECAEQLDWLRAQGCDKAQGYYLGRPAPLDALLATISPGAIAKV
jgi:PAS domain S-box-containing protein